MSRKTAILILCCLAQFMVILDVSVVNVALPSIRSDLGFSATGLQWVVNAYTLAFAGFLLLGGRAADLLGQRRVFVAGLALFGGASLLGGLSGSQGLLVGARGLQGLGGAIVAPATLSVLTTTFTEGGERNRALSAWGAMGGAGGAAGSLLGGILTDLLSWQWVLFINVPIAAAGAIAAWRLVEGQVLDTVHRRHFDLAGALTVTAGLVTLVFAIVRTDTEGWASAPTLLIGGLGVALLAVFVLIEARLSKWPLMPLALFSSRAISGANVVVFLLGSSVFAMWYFVSLYVQQVLGFSPIDAGLAFLPMTAAIIFASTRAARLVARFGAGRVLIAGMGAIAFGMALFALIRVHGNYPVDVLGPSLLTAAGIGLSFVPVTIAAMSGVAPAQAGLASGVINTSRQVGGSVGLAILATLAAQRTQAVAGGGPEALVAGFQRAFLVGALFAAAGVAAAALLVPDRGRAERPRAAEAARA